VKTHFIRSPVFASCFIALQDRFGTVTIVRVPAQNASSLILQRKAPGAVHDDNATKHQQ
jgi:hypothetical protein